MAQKITIIDTGCANLSSVKVAFDRLGVQTLISYNPADIINADKLILPGVGTAKAAITIMKERNLIELIREAKQPLLGICLGMQLLGQASEESMDDKLESVECLNIVSSSVKKMSVGNLRLPHMGWNQVNVKNDHPLFKNIPNNSYFYFVHSYAMELSANTVATCNYGLDFTAVVQKDNFMGTQFHPEKSGAVGAKLLTNFVEL